MKFRIFVPYMYHFVIIVKYLTNFFKLEWNLGIKFTLRFFFLSVYIHEVSWLHLIWNEFWSRTKKKKKKKTEKVMSWFLLATYLLDEIYSSVVSSLYLIWFRRSGTDKNFAQWQITQKGKKSESWFLSVAHRLHEIYPSMKFHYCISYGSCVMVHTRILTKGRWHNWHHKLFAQMNVNWSPTVCHL